MAAEVGQARESEVVLTRSTRCVLTLPDMRRTNDDPERDARREANNARREAARQADAIQRISAAKKAHVEELARFSGCLEQSLLRGEHSIFSVPS
mmetsp:Transcript_80028/g.138911  ORF Transcript_80028/g.138911 Transcript_80028/m.138911 type:complete len:95 (+) Transcript_80028:81-365(+)